MGSIMKLSDSELKSVTSRAATTRLTGSWLIVARTVWLAQVVPSLGLFVAGFPLFYARIQTACVGPVMCNIVGALTAKGLQALPALGFSVSGYATFYTIFWAIIAMIWCGIGFLIFWRRSDDWLALLAAFFLVMFITTFPGLPTSILALTYPVLNVPTTLMSVLGQASIGVFFLLFPSGRLAPRWMVLILPLLIIQEVAPIFPPTSPFNVNNWPGWLNGPVALVVYGSIIFSQVYRYQRESTPVQRQQTKWVVLGIIAVATGFIAFGVLFSVLFPAVGQSDSPYSVILDIAYPLLTLLLPLSIGVAILRYRLYDIDVLINRTLVYALLTGVLVVLYVGLIFGLESLVGLLTRQTSQPVIIVISTLAIAALIQPLRHRIQNLIDRRFYRHKYDAQKTLAAYNATLRSEVDLNQLREQLLVVVNETMQPVHVSLWLRSPQRHTEKSSRHLEQHDTMEEDS
jgi:hypothetical protein